MNAGVANTSAMVRPKEIPNATFTYQKIFGEDEFFAAGILRIEVGGCKAPKNSRDNAYVSSLKPYFTFQLKERTTA